MKTRRLKDYELLARDGFGKITVQQRLVFKAML